MAARVMSYTTLTDYVSVCKRKGGKFTTNDATRLWTTMTAHLPVDDPRCFTLYGRGRQLIPLEDYRAWLEATPESTRRDLRTEERRKWSASWALLLHFYWSAQGRTINGYGSRSSELLAAWLGGL